jgi:hypothetical protein
MLEEMNRRRPRFSNLLIGVVGAVLLALVTISALAGNSTDPGSPSAEDLTATWAGIDPRSIAPTEVPGTPRPQSETSGAPAIRPSIANPEIGQPAFTEADVRAYFAGQPSSGKVQWVIPDPVIDTIEFIELDGTLVCVVTLRGDFAVSMPGGPAIHYDTSVMVFDAITGNLKSVSAGPRTYYD